MTAPSLEARFRVTVGGGAGSFSVDVDLALPSGVLVLFGPSGSGKSLTLQTLAGLLRPSRGFVRVGGDVLFDEESGIDVPADKRRVGYVPQHQSLFPFLDVAGNVAFGVAPRRRARTSPTVLALLDELGLAHRAKARPADLSGGERQRVALARALAASPRLLLLDEPFAAIDQDGRRDLREVLRATLRRRSLPAVFVTHDADEALELADTVARFERGRTAELGPPEAVLRRGAPVTVSGTVSELRPLGDGRARVALTEATVEGPLDLLEPPAEGPVAIVLHTRPRGPG